jgi:NitT/TauT family transport system substrate-binding protein
MLRTSLLRGWFLALFIGAVPHLALAQTKPPTKLALAFIGWNTTSNWPGLIGQQKGFFLEEGLDIDWITTGQSAKAAQQVMAGVTPLGSSSTVDTLRAIDGGGDLQIFMNSVANGLHQMIAAKDVKDTKQLKGKRVIVGGQKDITALWWYAMAKKNDLDPKKDVDVIFAGSTANRVAALMSGGVQGAVLSPPASFQAVEQGYTDLGPMAGYLGELPIVIYHVNKTWAAKNKDKIVAFVRAHNKAVRYMLDPKNRQEVSEILAKHTNTTVSDALKTYDLSMKVKGYVGDGVVTQDGLKRAIDMLVADGDLKTPVKPNATFFDPQYLEAANASK